MAETEDIKQIKSSLLQLSGRLNVVNKNISKLENLNQNLKLEMWLCFAQEFTMSFFVFFEVKS